jgi:hypothetical protein
MFVTIGFFCVLASSAFGQNARFTFDLPGNLLSQAPEAIGLPQILGQPQNQIVAPGEAASFSVVVVDTRALSYQWRFNDTNLPAASSDALLLTNVSAANEGPYSVVLANSSGSITSAPALLMLDADGDSLPDSWEQTYFTNLNQTATGDFDGDGVQNLQEFLDGTNPTNSASALFRLFILNDGGSVVAVPDQPTYTNGQSVTLTATASGPDPFHAWTGDVTTRSNVISLTITNNKTVFAHFNPIVFEWTNAANGDWNTATNWTPNLAPGSNDTVIITTSGATVTLNTAADLADFTLGDGVASPTLSGSGTLTVRGNCLWSSGNMSGSGRTIIASGASLNFANASGISLTTRTLENGGTMQWTGVGNIAMNGAVITNRAGALFSARNPTSIAFAGGSSRLDNAGTFRNSASAGTTTIQSGISFNNSGTVEIQGGTLALGGGGFNTGTITVPAGSTLNFSGGNFTSSGSPSITGAGHLTVSGATATLAGLVIVGGTNTFSNGTANLTGNYICTNNTLNISGGTANFDGLGTVAPAIVNLSQRHLERIRCGHGNERDELDRRQHGRHRADGHPARCCA